MTTVRCTLLFFVVTVSTVLSQPAQNDWEVYGARQFDKKTGYSKTDKPDHYTESFTVPVQSDLPCTLQIINGDEQGNEHRTSGATVVLNGKTICTQSDFQNNVNTIQRDVVVKGANTCDVTVYGRSGGHIIIHCLYHFKSVHPIVECVRKNPDGSHTAQFGYQNDNSVDVTTPIGLLNLFFPLPIDRGQPTVFKPGRHTNVFSVVYKVNALIWELRGLQAVANNDPSLACGTTDTTKPTMSVTSPIDGLLTRDSVVTVTGTVSDQSSVTVTINGVPATVTNGSFQGVVSLQEGTNVITIKATDASNNTTTIVRNIVRASTPPSLTVSAPSIGIITNQTSIAVSGTVTDAHAVTVSVNGTAVSIAQNGSWTDTAALKQGTNTITVVAADAVGNTATISRTVTADWTPPAITVSSPLDSTITKLSSITVSGMVKDSTAVTLTVNGNSVPVNKGAFTTQIILKEGTNKITIVATDAAGNTTSISRTVRVDRIAPALVVSSPLDSVITNLPSITISGTVKDSTAVNVTVNGNSVPVSNDLFNITTALNNGTNKITVVATDAAGNQTTVTRTVILNTQALSLNVAWPTDSLLTINPFVSVSGTALGVRSGSNVTINGTIVSLNADGSFSVDWHLIEGTNNISVSATGSDGKTITINRLVILDTIPPVITLVSPTVGAETSDSILTVSGNVVDILSVSLTINGTAVPIGKNGVFSIQLPMNNNLLNVTVTSTDVLGNSSTITRQVSHVVIPPDPVTVAPAINTTTATTLNNATAFLYTGSNPIQKNVDPAAIDPIRIAVVRGKILDRNLSALAGAKISILGHPELGYTYSRIDGMFDLAVNGGGNLILKYDKLGYLSIQRQAEVAWQNYTAVDSAIMIRLDTNVTPIHFSDSIEVARGGVVNDQSGTRQVTLMFRQGTVATAIKKNYTTKTIVNGCTSTTLNVLVDSTTQILPTMSIRATEYTVGANGPNSMPAALPPSSAYTYCVELSADEAIAMNAVEVVFDQPVSVYLENFLQFPVGTIIPVGYYDRSIGSWIACPDGGVIQIIDTANGIAHIDVDGDGIAESEDSLIEMGFDHVELEKLASMYSPGQTLWWSQVQHFSPYDGNMVIAILKSLGPYPNKINKTGCNKGNCGDGSVIQIQQQSLGETLPVIGTPLNLWYTSDRINSYKENYHLHIPISGNTISKFVEKMNVAINIAGRTIQYSYLPDTNVSCDYIWDGKDAYGRIVQGEFPYTVNIGYVYPSYYVIDSQSPAGQSFGNPSSDIEYVITARPLCSVQNTVQTSTGFLGVDNANSQKLGGFNVDIQHQYDCNSKKIYFGNGTVRSADNIGQIISTVPGTGLNADTFGEHAAMAVDGTIIFSSSYQNQIYRRCPDGTVSVYAGTGDAGYSGDGRMAINAQLNNPRGIAVASDGTVYVADKGNNVIRKITPDGIISTFAGTGSDGWSDDGINATDTPLGGPVGVAIGPDGSVFIVEQSYCLVRKVDAHGIIHIIAGDGDGGDSTLAYYASLYNPSGISIDHQGNIFIADTYDNSIRKITTDGMIYTVAGNGNNDRNNLNDGNGGKAIEAQLVEPNSVAVTNDGMIYITEQRECGQGIVRCISPNGIITTIAGNGEYWSTTDYGDAGPALQSVVAHPTDIFIGQDGNVYVCDGRILFCASTMTIPDNADYFIRKIAPAFPGVTLAQQTIASEDGSELYVFDESGRHLRTVDALTNVTKYSFGYDLSGRLTSVYDVDSLKTTIKRDSSGNPLAIVSPYGQQTAFVLDTNGYLAKSIDPAGDTTCFTYTADGLMTSMTDAKKFVHSFLYDSLGRLALDIDPAGGFKKLARVDSDSGFEVTVTTAEGRHNKYKLENMPTGGVRKTNTDETGLATVITDDYSGTTITTTPDGTVTNEIALPDSRFGMQAPATTTTTTTPSGLTAVLRHYRVVSQMSGLTVLGMGDYVALNDQVYSTLYDGINRKFTTTTPQGRQSFSWIDSLGRVIMDSIPNVAATTYTYLPAAAGDLRGKLVAVSQAGKTASYVYNAQGFLTTATDPIRRTSRFEYDSVGRITKQVLPDNHDIRYTYDSNGNLTSLTPPHQEAGGQTSKPIHSFDYTSVDLTSKYTPPLLDSMSTVTGYQYNKDKQILNVIRPDGGVIETIYDTVGCGSCGGSVSRPKEILFDRGMLNFSYSPTTGQLDTLIAPEDTTIYSYDGPLLTSLVKGVTNPQYLKYSYDNNFRVTDQELWVTNPNSEDFDALNYYDYDQDGLLTTLTLFQYTVNGGWWYGGSMGIEHDPSTGRVNGTVCANVTTSQDYDSSGAISYFEADYSGSSIFQTSYQRDSLNRISILTEVNQGKMTVKKYAYDILGRLEKVWRNDTINSTYSYDPNGNRIARWTPSKIDSGFYDAQDRMISYGNAQYIYSKNGELQKKIVGTDTTSYTYDYFGNLIKVTLPNGDLIEYMIDGQNRRIGKKLNGSIEKKWIYAGGLSPIAELDSAYNVTAEFVGSLMIKNCNTYQLITDHLGSVRLVVNVSDGTIAQQLEYDEFGNVISNSNPDFQPFAYAGGLYDTQTKLVRFGARDYDASVGRWIVKDPIKFGGRQTNLYDYVNLDPINIIDPSGLFASPWHAFMAFTAAKAMGFSTIAANMIASADVETDIGTQGTESSQTAMHAMAGIDPITGEYQSTDVARLMTGNFISSQLSLANQAKQKGDCLSYYSYLGRALHAAQDQWASGHNYQQWLGGILPSPDHEKGDWFPSETEISNAIISSIMVLGGNVDAAIRR